LLKPIFIEGYKLHKFVPFNSNVHFEEFRQMNIEFMTWMLEELTEHFDFNPSSLSETPVRPLQEYIDEHLKEYTNLKPPEGTLYILEIHGNVAGMGVIRKHSDDIGVQVCWI
jgi:hypothetical protein